MTPIDVSNIILTLSEPEMGDLISNLKLQKLLYYVQGFHLAKFDAPLFEGDIKAWQYGPVSEEAYHAFKEFGSGAITPPENFDINALNLEKDQLMLILDVNSLFGQYSAVKLMNMTHSEPPWLGTPIGEVIPQDLLKNYFKTQLA